MISYFISSNEDFNEILMKKKTISQAVYLDWVVVNGIVFDFLFQIIKSRLFFSLKNIVTGRLLMLRCSLWNCSWFLISDHKTTIFFFIKKIILQAVYLSWGVVYGIVFDFLFHNTKP